MVAWCNPKLVIRNLCDSLSNLIPCQDQRKDSNIKILISLLLLAFSTPTLAVVPDMACAFSKHTRVSLRSDKPPEVSTNNQTMIIRNGIEKVRPGPELDRIEIPWEEVQRTGIGPMTQVFFDTSLLQVLTLVIPIEERLAMITREAIAEGIDSGSITARVKSGNSYQAFISGHGVDYATYVTEGECEIL